LTFEIGAENTFVLLRSKQRLPELEICASGGQKKGTTTVRHGENGNVPYKRSKGKYTILPLFMKEYFRFIKISMKEAYNTVYFSNKSLNQSKMMRTRINQHKLQGKMQVN
jgi:hypothetical protein